MSVFIINFITFYLVNTAFFISATGFVQSIENEMKSEGLIPVHDSWVLKNRGGFQKNKVSKDFVGGSTLLWYKKQRVECRLTFQPEAHNTVTQGNIIYRFGCKKVTTVYDQHPFDLH